MKKYFLLNTSTERKVIGKYPPVKDSFHELRSLGRNSYLNRIPEIDKKLKFDIEDKAKINSSILSQDPPRLLLISEKTKEIFEKTNLITHQFFPVILTHKTKEYNYYIFYPYKKHLEGINIPESLFENYEEKNLRYNNKKEVEKHFSDTGLLNAITEVSLTEEYKELDLFFFHRSHLGELIISSKLKNLITENKLTGFKIEEIPEHLLKIV